jgi:GAF domain-containing protein
LGKKFKAGKVILLRSLLYGYIIDMKVSETITIQKPVSVDVSKTLDGFLARTGKALKASRSYIFMIDSHSIGKNTHEWCLPGISSQKNSLASFCVNESWIKKLREDGVILVSDIDQIELKIRAELGRQNIMSLAVVSLMEGEKLWGFLGVDECVVPNREWKPEEIQTLRSFAGLIGEMYKQVHSDSPELI